MAKQLAEITYSNTDKNNTLFKDFKPEVWYEISEKDKNILNWVLKRFQDMRSFRTRIDTDWQLFQLISESKFYPYADWRTRVNVPVLRALIELFVSEATTRRIDKKINPVWMSDLDKAEAMNKVWEYDWNKNRRDEAMTEAEYKCATFWTVAYLTDFLQTSRVIEDPDDVNDDWEIKFTKKLMTQWKIILKTLDIRNVYWDDRVTNFDDANDEIYIEYLTPEMFEAEKENKNYKNLQYVWTWTKTDQVYFNWEDLGRINTGLIEKMHYWNKQKDRYIVIFNRQVVAREIPLPYAHKELPIVPRQYGYLTDSIYWRWLAEACMQFADKINRLSEMLFDWIARSNNSIFAIGGGLTFDWNKFSFNNQIIKFNGQLNDANFREIKWVPPNQSAFQYLQDLLKEIAVYVGIDISQIIWQPSSTAFQTAVQTESSLKRVNVVLVNRDYALQKVFTRHLSNLMQFFPMSSVEKILEIDSKWKVTKWEKQYPKILMNDKKYIADTWKFVDAPWKYEFEVKPEYIRGQFDMEVKTNFNSPTLKALKQENMTNFLKWYAMYAQLAQDPNLSKILKPDDFIKELAYTYDIDISSIGGFSDSITKEKEKLMGIVKQMAWVEEWQSPLASIWWGELPQQPQEQSMLPNVESKWLPNVTTPKMPSINNLSPAEKIMM